MYITEERLAQEAGKARRHVGKTRSEVAQDLGVSLEAVCAAEEGAHTEAYEVRRRMLQRYAGLRVVGPFYLLQREGNHDRASGMDPTQRQRGDAHDDLG